MTTLLKNTPRALMVGELEAYPVIAGDIIYQGAAVGANAGYSRPLEAGDVFQGFAEEKADNSDGLDGAVRVDVRRRGFMELAVTGADTVAVNARPLVYAADDDTFTLTVGANSKIGRVSRWVSAGVAVVEFDAMASL